MEKINPHTLSKGVGIKHPVRTISGIAPVAVLTKPYTCPGRCVYCPKEAGMPKSYLSNEPAAARALRLKFDPYAQVIERITTLEKNGHPTDKIELIVKGGTWSVYTWKYQEWFVEQCFCAANQFLSSHREEPRRKVGATWRSRAFSKNNGIASSPPTSSKLWRGLAMTLKKVQKQNERAKHRIIGLTLETRPDWIRPEEILRLRELGCTRVELGVQTTDDKILKKIKRGHNLEQVKLATKLLKDAGFKVDYHLMPMLPSSTPAKDWQMFQKVFKDPDLRPDMIKIYPCTVIKGSELYHWWRRGLYKPYSNKKLLELLIKVKSQIIPRYCRISRLIRDIPSISIEAGNRVTNLRQVIQAEMEKRGLRCKCLRCREIGHQKKCKVQSAKCKTICLRQISRRETTQNSKLFIDKYKASGGVEYFLSIEDLKRKVVYAFCRLRLSKSNVALIRELHTYGHLVPIGAAGIVQHTGLGRQLMKKAEKIAKKAGYKKITVIAGIGVREYYRKLGYRKEGTYMVRGL